ncbi:unnamed protein product, partial [Mesorhabditis belari]|uniref:CBS domain-containing protein n=1 Tax=Mesorhabditis belari TaxID=2138241 RepID=A0AAF3FSC2_9BILA
MDGSGLRRNKATTFLPDSVIDLSHAFVVPLKHVPLDGLLALQNGGDTHFADISVPTTSDGPASPKSSQNKEAIYTIVASVPIDEPDFVYTHLLQLSQCYEAMALNQKIVAFTSDMPVRKAFYGLVYNSTRTGLIVDPKSYNIIGVLSVTDFIMVLMKLWKYQKQINENESSNGLSPQVLADLVGCMPVSRWKEHQKLDSETYRGFITANIKDSLFHAVRILWSRRVHRLPIMDKSTNDCMFILTHRRILHFLWNYCLLLPRPAYMSESIQKLQLGCWKDIIYVEERTPLIDVLDLLIDQRVSGVPVVENGSKKLVNVYTRFDAIAVGFDENFPKLDMSVEEAVNRRSTLFGGTSGGDSVVTVAENATMWTVLEVFIERNVHRLFAIDDNNNLKGVISLSDMIWYMVIRPYEDKHKTMKKSQ